MPLLVAEFVGYFVTPGSLLDDIDGEGEDVEELMPLVWMCAGVGRLILSDWVAVAEAEGAILNFVSQRSGAWE